MYIIQESGYKAMHYTVHTAKSYKMNTVIESIGSQSSQKHPTTLQPKWAAAANWEAHYKRKENRSAQSFSRLQWHWLSTQSEPSQSVWSWSSSWYWQQESCHWQRDKVSWCTLVRTVTCPTSHWMAEVGELIVSNSLAAIGNLVEPPQTRNQF